MAQLQFIEIVFQHYEGEESGHLMFAQRNKYFKMDDYDQAKNFYNEAIADISKYLPQDEGGLWGHTNYNDQVLLEYYSDFVHPTGGYIDYLPVSLKVVELN